MTTFAPIHCIKTLEKHFKNTAYETGLQSLPESVLNAFCAVNRAAFVPLNIQTQAWDDSPLSIEDNQTISQPFIVTLMTALADIGPEDTVLEIGTGSGYQAAILSLLAQHVVTLEVHPRLSQLAQQRLEGWTNIEFHITQGECTVSPKRLYDAIIVTCCAQSVPQALLDQLKPEGRLIIPIQTQEGQMLYRITQNDTTHTIKQTPIIPVRFVPMV
jgi:protein-L-isoaspartate(D-aspartate) O-methyltransferase